MYEFASEEAQRYKEGKTILERALIKEEENTVELVESMPIEIAHDEVDLRNQQLRLQQMRNA